MGGFFSTGVTTGYNPTSTVFDPRNAQTGASVAQPTAAPPPQSPTASYNSTPTNNTANSLGGAPPIYQQRNDRSVPGVGSSDVSTTPTPPTPAATSALGAPLPNTSKIAAIQAGGLSGGAPGPNSNGPSNPNITPNPTAGQQQPTAAQQLPYDPAKFINNGPYQGNASANYAYWLNNPGAAGNPLSPSGSSANGAYSGPLGFLSGQTGQGPLGPDGNPIVSSYNPNLFADPSTAAGIASWLGNGYSVGSQGVTAAAPGSPFSFPNAATITGLGGSTANAGDIASQIRAFGNSPSYLQQLINSDFGQPLTLQQQLAQAPVGSLTAAQLAGATQSGPGGAITLPQQGTNPQASGYNPALSGTQQLPSGQNYSLNGAFTSPAAQNFMGLSAQDLMSFLNAYAGLSGNSATPPVTQPLTTSDNSTNSLLAMLFGGGYDTNNDIYMRQRNYPAAP